MSGISAVQSLKSAAQTRVRIDQTERNAGQRLNLGEGVLGGAMCDLVTDVYGRYVGQNTLLLNSSECSHYNKWSAVRRINVENAERPMVAIPASGLRGAADFMGHSRDHIPQNLYGEGHQGNFVRQYNTPNNAPPQAQAPCDGDVAYYQRRIQPWSGSMAAATEAHRG
jgi:hypothetical protein